MSSIKDKILNSYYDEKEKYILINYLIKIITEKLNAKEDLYNRGLLKKETEIIMYKLSYSINLLLFEYGLKSERNSDILFNGIEFKYISIKIIKNTPNEKEIFIYKRNIRQIFDILMNEINNSKNKYLLDINELNEYEFVKNIFKKLEITKSEKMGIIRKKKIENFQKSNSSSSLDSIVNGIKDIRTNSEDNEIYNREIEIKDENEKKLVELINIIDLKNKIKKILNDEKNEKIQGILITQNITDKSHLYDTFYVEIIN